MYIEDKNSPTGNKAHYVKGAIKMNETQTFTLGKYAEQRREILERNRPDVYNAMLESGSLNAHLTAVQEKAANYVENYVARYTHSE